MTNILDILMDKFTLEDMEFTDTSYMLNPHYIHKGTESFLNSVFKTVEDKGNYVEFSSFPVHWFSRLIKKKYHTTKLNHLYECMGFVWRGKTTIRIHKFFLPEIIYLLNLAPSGRKLAKDLIDNTWVKLLYEDAPGLDRKIDFDLINSEMNVKLFEHQNETIQAYSKITKSLLNGCVLGLNCGFGKTITSLALMKSLNLDKIIVLAPKSTLVDVWIDHLHRFYKNQPEYWLVGEPPKDAYAYICNYESMEKLPEIYKYLKGKTVGIIVDESHNFLKSKSNRTQNLIQLRKDTNSQDVVMMSGTPVKALGSEMIPILKVIDKVFDEDAEVIFKKALGLNSVLATDILHNRMSLMMFRKMELDDLKLPEKREADINVKVPRGKDYTIPKVMDTLKLYQEQRKEHHEKHKYQYEEEWKDCVTYLMSKTRLPQTEDYKRWDKFIKHLRAHGFSRFDKYTLQETEWANTYEKKVIIPTLPRELALKFKHCRSAYKYVDLKIQGETLGFLDTLRSQMTESMLESANLKDMIDGAVKKTIIFTTYVDVVEKANDILTKQGYKPIMVYGKTPNVTQALETFRKDPSVNPLICTIQTLATGVTLTEANRSIFINRPWRQADYKQASDRIYRIGQDIDVDIYTLTLDTGDEPNLSTRMKDILSWSKEMSDAIVDGSMGVETLVDIGLEKYATKFKGYEVVNFNFSELDEKVQKQVLELENLLNVDHERFLEKEMFDLFMGSDPSKELNKSSRYVLVLKAGKVVGYTEFKIKSGTLVISRVFVDTAYRAEGIGSFLMDVVINWGKRYHCKMADLKAFYDNTNAIGLYKKKGFYLENLRVSILTRNLKGNILESKDLSEGWIRVGNTKVWHTLLGGSKGESLYISKVPFNNPNIMNDIAITLAKKYPNVKLVTVSVDKDINPPSGWTKVSITMKAKLDTLRGIESYDLDRLTHINLEEAGYHVQ